MAPGWNLSARSRRASSKVVVTVESLEGRRLPSMMMLPSPGAPASYTGMGGAGNGGGSSQSAAGTTIKVGSATKKPHFYELYTGPMRPDLDAVAATANLTDHNQRLVLTGTMAGKIDRSPTVAADQSFFVFGINRGSATNPGPFPDRPDIRFDAVVAVSVVMGGIGASTTDLITGVTSSLPASAVSVRGKMVTVVVPTSLLPSTGFALNQYRVNLWPRSELPPADFHTVASFVPETTTFRVGSSHR
jgi:hypothetical protein